MNKTTCGLAALALAGTGLALAAPAHADTPGGNSTAQAAATDNPTEQLSNDFTIHAFGRSYDFIEVGFGLNDYEG
ncbi:hypothetical protein LUR56_00940 [Streptomyces sp. MT29]|nr:hypothetical protein [Streptomyces sp. MT29]